MIMCIVITILVSILLLILYFRLKHYHSLLKEKETINQKMLLLEEKHYKEMLKKMRIYVLSDMIITFILLRCRGLLQN